VAEPLVSVIIPSYDRFDSLLRAIESVNNQTLQDFEIIIVNDGSNDERYYKKNFGKNVKLINLSKNSVEKKGYFSDNIRNHGIEISTAKYISFLDDDDYWMTNKLELQISKLETEDFKMTCSDAFANNGVFKKDVENKLYNQELMFQEISKIYKKSSLKDIFTRNLSYKFEFPQVWNSKFLKIHNCIITSSVVVEKKLLNRIGNFRDLKGKKMAADYDCWLGLLTHTDCYYFSEPLLYYDLNEGMNQKTL